MNPKLALLLFLCTPAYAIDTDKAAHFGVSYALTTGLYGLGKTICGKKCGYIFGIAGALAVGAIKEATDRKPDINDMAANAAGVGAATATIAVFNF